MFCFLFFWFQQKDNIKPNVWGLPCFQYIFVMERTSLSKVVGMQITVTIATGGLPQREGGSPGLVFLDR